MEPKGLLVLVARRPMQLFALRITRRFRDVVPREEILSAVDLGLLRAAQCYDAGKGPFSGFAAIWVKQEVYHLLRRELRWRQRYVSSEVSIEDAAAADDPARAAEQAEVVRLCAGDIDEVWRAHKAEGESLRDIARTYGLSLREVQTRIGRADRRLRRAHAPWTLPPRKPRHGWRRRW